jgi:hypothetical protein
VSTPAPARPIRKRRAAGRSARRRSSRVPPASPRRSRSTP